MQISPGWLRGREVPDSGSTTLSSAFLTTLPHEPDLVNIGCLANAGDIDKTGPASVMPQPYIQQKVLNGRKIDTPSSWMGCKKQTQVNCGQTNSFKCVYHTGMPLQIVKLNWIENNVQPIYDDSERKLEHSHIKVYGISKPCRNLIRI